MLAWLALATGVLGMVSLSGQSGAGQPSTKNGDWPYYTADARGTRYSPLDQITAANFDTMVVAWRFKTDNLGPRPEFKLEGTPLVIKGDHLRHRRVTRDRDLAGCENRRTDLGLQPMREGQRAAIAPRQLSGRGLSYWTDGNGDERVLFVTTGYRLVELNAKTGRLFLPSAPAALWI